MLPDIGNTDELVDSFSSLSASADYQEDLENLKGEITGFWLRSDGLYLYDFGFRIVNDPCFPMGFVNRRFDFSSQLEIQELF
jgi:hypothetical protein